MNKLMKSLCGTLWIALMCQSCDSAESYVSAYRLAKELCGGTDWRCSLCIIET